MVYERNKLEKKEAEAQSAVLSRTTDIPKHIRGISTHKNFSSNLHGRENKNDFQQTKKPVKLRVPKIAYNVHFTQGSSNLAKV